MSYFYRFLKAICKPGHCLREFIENQRIAFGAGNFLHVILCIGAGILLYWTAHIQSITDFLLATFVIVIVLALLCRFFNFIMYGILAVVSFLLLPFDKTWEFCDMHTTRQHERENEQKEYSGLGNEPKAEIGLRYFIRADKTSSPWNAQWLGD